MENEPKIALYMDLAFKLRISRDNCNTFDVPFNEWQWINLTNNIADLFALTDKNFNRENFLSWCGKFDDKTLEDKFT